MNQFTFTLILLLVLGFLVGVYHNLVKEEPQRYYVMEESLNNNDSALERAMYIQCKKEDGTWIREEKGLDHKTSCSLTK